MAIHMRICTRNLLNPCLAKYYCQISINKKNILKTFYRNNHSDASVSNTKDVSIDVEKLFINKKVQTILRNLTKVDDEKVFRPVQRSLSAPNYQFCTENELEQLMEDVKVKIDEKLHMPPVLAPRKPIEEVCSKDPELQGLNKNNIIFIDISPGIKDRNRLIVVRETNGLLRKASWEERDNTNQIFFPMSGRRMIIPHMFEDTHFEDILNRKQYEFILNRACAQFEPDNPKYIEITSKVYEHLNASRSFNDLRSTRHFGPMTFYLTVNFNIDNLLLEMIENDFLDDAVDLVKLYHIIHPDCLSAKDSALMDEMDFLMNFVEKDSKKKSYLELALQTMKELKLQSKIKEEGIKKAHGQ